MCCKTARIDSSCATLVEAMCQLKLRLPFSESASSRTLDGLQSWQRHISTATALAQLACISMDVHRRLQSEK